MIKSFRDRDTERIFRREHSRKFDGIKVQALKKLLLIHRSKDLNDLRVPPGNRLEALSGDRQGQYSVRVNDQWRICFVWENGNAYDVEIVDYH